MTARKKNGRHTKHARARRPRAASSQSDPLAARRDQQQVYRELDRDPFGRRKESR